jgi:L-ascorbate metabolism protein UlaG (beta-lactamase superfamily)
MELTKHAHACVTLTKQAGHLVIDPGMFSADAAELIAETDAVLVTHEHADHFNEEVIAQALQDRPELTVYGPAAVVGRWDARPRQIVAVADGDTLRAGGFEIAVFGQHHAAIHPDVPIVANVGYLVDGEVYHPGDSYHVPQAQVSTLLLPTSGPWTKLGESVDFARAVGAGQLIQIHEMLLSDVGQQATKMFLSPQMLSKVPLEIVAVGETVSL